MIVGERKKVSLASSYAKNPMFGYAEEFTNVTKSILEENGIDYYGNTRSALMQSQTHEQLKQFFIENSFDQAQYANDPEGLEEHVQDMEAQFENDIEAVLEHTSLNSINPVIGMTFPLHKWILMNMVFDKGGIQKVVAQSPKFTISQETRILIDTNGNEIDMFREQHKMTAAINATAAAQTFEVTLPLLEDVEIVHDKLGGLAGSDKLDISTHVSAIKVENVYFEVGDLLPDENGFISSDSKVCASPESRHVWVPVKYTPVPGYFGQDFDRAIMKKFTYKYKVNNSGQAQEKTITDTLSIGMKKDRLIIQSLSGTIKAVQVTSKLDTSNHRATTCSATWRADTIIEEIGPAIPISTTISPEEVKDISALYNVNQVTKIMHLMKTVLANYKDDMIKNHLDESYQRMPLDQKTFNTFDFSPRVGYDGDHVQWRVNTFIDFLNAEVQQLFNVLNDPNMTVTIYGDPSLVRMITPDSTDCSYTSPQNIGPVDLDFEKSVYTSHKLLYNFIGSDKLRNTSDFIVILKPHNTDRIIYRIYDYQMYLSNEIRNADNPSLPALTAFERWKFHEYFPVQGRIHIENPRGINKSTYGALPVQIISN